MPKFKTTTVIVGPLVALLLFCFPVPATAMKFMSLKDAITYFLPKGSKPSKVQKSIPANKISQLKKRFRLRETADFKETISKGPYTFYIGRNQSNDVTVYIVVLEQNWRTCEHKLAVAIEPNGKIKEVVVVELNCRYAYPIKRKNFLKQFKGKSARPGKKVPLEIGNDVDAISGATASSDATAIISRRALALYELFFR